MGILSALYLACGGTKPRLVGYRDAGFGVVLGWLYHCALQCFNTSVSVILFCHQRASSQRDGPLHVPNNSCLKTIVLPSLDLLYIPHDH